MAERRDGLSEGPEGAEGAGERPQAPAEGPEGARPVPPAGERGARRVVAASLMGVLVIGAYFTTSVGQESGLPAGYLISAAVLLVAFWFPAMGIGSARDVLAGGVRLAAWLVAWTAVWDLATSGLMRERALFDEWWIVYPSGVLVLGGLLALHGVVVGRVEAKGGR